MILSSTFLIRYRVNHITSGPIVALEILGDHALTRWLEVIGPEDSEEARAKAPSSIRACYGKDKIYNAVHGSKNEKAAEKVCTILKVFKALETLTHLRIKLRSEILQVT